MADNPIPRSNNRSRGSVLGFFILLALVIGLVGLHKAGYAILTDSGGKQDNAEAGMVLLSCTYFTGTERVINHTFRKPDVAANSAKCPVVVKLLPAQGAN